MADKTSAVDEFLEQVNEDKTLKPEADPFAGVTVEQKEEPVVKEEKEEKPLPFHEDPKVKRYIEKEVAKLTRNLTPTQEAQFREEVSDKPDLVDAFTKIIGNDTAEKVNALNLLKETIEGIRSEARSATEMLEAERRADYEAEAELDKGFDDIENDFDVDITSNDPQARKTRNEFIDFIKRVAPKNEYGEVVEYPDFHETFSLFQETRKKTPVANRAKDLAARSMERGGDASAPPVPDDTSWKGVEKFFAKLKG